MANNGLVASSSGVPGCHGGAKRTGSETTRLSAEAAEHPILAAVPPMETTFCDGIKTFKVKADAVEKRLACLEKEHVESIHRN